MASVKFYDRNDHCVAVIRFAMPSVGGHASVCGIGDTNREALARASSIASRIAGDPVIGALMPTREQAAIVAAKGLAAAAHRGPAVLRSLWARMPSSAKKALAARLMHEQHQELGFAPLAVFAAQAAAKYGPGAARAIRKRLKNRRPRQRPSSPSPELEQQQPEAPEDSPEQDEGSEAAE